MTQTVGALLAAARPRLAAAALDGAPVREAALLLGYTLGLSEAQVLAREERGVPPETAARFAELLDRRLRGEPFAYLTGEREFFGRSFHVDPRVLIPRPETEHAIEAALRLAGRGTLPPAPRILDVGTGSGCLAVTLALEIPAARVVATDLSPGALAVARGNARRLGAREQVALLALDLTAGLDLRRFDLVVSNPPYIDAADAPSLSPEVCKFEPHLALFSPGAGDSTLARLFAQCGDREAGIAAAATVIVEIGAGQLDAARRHAGAAGLAVVEVVGDYQGIPRTLLLRRA
ncbi:MAG TPA: peptide chain release factor N(5)-glutamine methyltransferase [Thermoanaerobaculia bacterium]